MLAFPVSRVTEWMRVYRASPEIESTPACRGNLEIESTLVFPVSRGIEWMRVYRVNLEVESMPAGRGGRAITYKIFPAELRTAAIGKIGVRRI